MAVTYDAWVAYEYADGMAAYTEGHGAPPGAADAAHLSWQRIVDHREYQNWLEACRTKDTAHEPPWVSEDAPTDPPVVPSPPLDPARVGAPRSDYLGRWSSRPLFMYGGMSAEERREQLVWMRSRGHYTVPLAIHNDYPQFPQWQWDWWQSPDDLRAAVLELRRAGMVPWLVCHPKPGLGMADHLVALSGLWPAVGDIVPALVWGWEINDLGGEWSNGGRQLDYIRALKRISNLPIWAHFTCERWSGWPGYDGQDQDRDEVEWLRRARETGLTGLAYQDSYQRPLRTSEQDGVLDRALSIPSPHGWSPGIAGRVVDGAGVAFALFEFSRDETRHAYAVSELERDSRVSGWC